MLSRLRIGPKLLLAPGVVLLLLMVLSIGAYYAMVRQNASLETIVHQRAVHMRDASTLVSEAHQAHTQIYQLLSWISGGFSRVRIDALIFDIHQRHTTLERRFIALRNATGAGSAERRFVQQAEAAHGTYVKAVLDVIELSQADLSTSANAMSIAERRFAVVAARLAELAQLERQLSEQASDSAAADFRAMSVLMPLLVAVSVVLSLAITMAVRRALLAEVTGISQAALDLASGDLTVRERDYGSDEISETSRALDTSIRNLNSTLKTIFASARSIDSASREIARGSVHLSDRKVAHESSLGHTASSMDELSATINKTATSALVANRLAEAASSHALRSGDVIGQLVGTMASIKGRSRKMVEMVDVIDGIASETNVLALNAVVEAARAGPEGHGFAQVAAEVRVLAQRSAAAARQIRELIAQAVNDIDGGSLSAGEAGENLVDIVASVQQVGDIINQISNANAAQASGFSEVSQAIVEMDEMTQQNSLLVEQAAAAAETLQHQANSLARAVASFKLDEAVLLPPAPPPAGSAARAKPHLHLAKK